MADQSNTTEIEEWRAVVGHEKAYQVSNFGNVRSIPHWVNSKNGSFALKQGKALKLFRQPKTGYLEVQIGKKHKTVHRMVCEAFHGPSPDNKAQVAHKDGSRDNNRPDNLRWASAKENAEDRNGHGTAPIGENAPSGKLTEKEVLEIRRLYEPRYGSLAELGRKFGVTRTQILHIVRRRQWTHI